MSPRRTTVVDPNAKRASSAAPPQTYIVGRFVGSFPTVIVSLLGVHMLVTLVWIWLTLAVYVWGGRALFLCVCGGGWR